jgi:peptidoglycan hydrolase CwlO-like protein
LFKEYSASGYVNPKIDYQISFEKEKHDLQKQIDDFNALISKDVSFIKDKQKEVNKNRRQVKKLKFKLDECSEKDPNISAKNSSSSSSF